MKRDPKGRKQAYIKVVWLMIIISATLLLPVAVSGKYRSEFSRTVDIVVYPALTAEGTPEDGTLIDDISTVSMTAADDDVNTAALTATDSVALTATDSVAVTTTLTATDSAAVYETCGTGQAAASPSQATYSEIEPEIPLLGTPSTIISSNN